MTTEQAKDPAKKPQAKTPVRPLIAGVHGDMYHMYTGVKIPQHGVRMERDSWIDAQIVAGKLQIVEE